MVTMMTYPSRSEWLEGRKKTIGGSDAAAILGLSNWMTNVELWELKTGRTESKEQSSPLMTYGQEAEEYLRELFKLDYPGLKVFYEPNNLFMNPAYPWAHASLDGWLEDEEGKRGVLEIKTASPMSGEQYRKWQGKIPDNYFAQVLHEMAVYEADFAIVKAQLKRMIKGEMIIETRHYLFLRDDEEINFLMDQEREFYEHILSGERPSLILPEV